MSARSLLILIAAAVGLGLLALLFSGTQNDGTASGGLLLPELADRLNDVDRVTVTGPGNEGIATLERTSSGWQVADSGYPADVGRLRKNLIALSEARILEVKTANPEFYERLGVVDIADESATGVQLELNAGDAQLARVLIGDTGLGAGNGAYLRVNGDAQSYLVEADLDPGRTRGEWLDSQVIDIPSSDIRRVTITQVDGETLELEKDSADATEFRVLNIPAGRETSFPGVANSIGAVLAKLELDDVQPADEFTPPGPPILARFETFGGLVIEAQSFRVEDGWRVVFSAGTVDGEPGTNAGEAASANDAKPGDEDDAEDAAADTAKSGQTGKPASARAAAINARVAGWLYTLPGYKTDQLIKRLEDLLAAPGDE